MDAVERDSNYWEQPHLKPFAGYPGARAIIQAAGDAALEGFDCSGSAAEAVRSAAEQIEASRLRTAWNDYDRVEQARAAGRA